MPFAAHLPGYKLYDAVKNSAFRLGVYIGLCLSIGFSIWLIVANRLPLFERLAMERNILAASAMTLFALVPIVRFIRRPGSLLASGLISWTIFSFIYRLLCLFFSGLSSWHSATQVFMLGIFIYLIAATFSWIISLIWRVRASHASHRENHQLT